MVNSSGTQVEDKVYLLEVDFYTGANATGTVYPTAAVDSTGSGGGATITYGYQYSSSYPYWKAFDNSTGSGWWTLGLNNVAGSNQDKNWIQMELTGALKLYRALKFNHKRHLLMEITFRYWEAILVILLEKRYCAEP